MEQLIFWCDTSQEMERLDEAVKLHHVVQSEIQKMWWIGFYKASPSVLFYTEI